MKQMLCAAFAAVLFLSAGLSSQDILAPGAELEKLAGDFEFTEGPAANANGDVFFTDQPNDRIMEWSTNGELTTFMQPSGRSNGLCFDSAGFLWACADEKNQLWRIAPDKSVEVILAGFDDKLFNGPNDLWIAPNGGVYFTDPYYKRDYWKREQGPLPVKGVFYVPPDRKNLARVAEDLIQPNGIIGTPNGKKLYVSDIKDGKTYSYKIKRNGELRSKKLFCEMGSDGMTIDEQGNVYLTGKGVTIFNKKGCQIAHIDVPEAWTANVCFGGRDKKTLFITASKGLYAMQMSVAGVDSQ